MSEALELDINGLYVLLSDRGENSFTFHWALYLHQSENFGYIYDLTNAEGSTIWRFDPQPSNDVKDSKRVVLAMKIGVLNTTLHRALLNRLEQIPIAYSTRYKENITCRVWLKEALFALDDEGYIDLIRSVDDIEAEANIRALANKSLGHRSVIQSAGSEA